MPLGRSKKSAPKPVMNVTPLVDVVLVLLIIFMIVIPAAADQVKIELPGILNPDEEDPKAADPLLVSLATDGRLFLNEDEIPKGKTLLYLTAAHRREPKRRLVLRADEQVKYFKVRELMKVVQDIGFPGISLRVNERAEDEGAKGAK